MLTLNPDPILFGSVTDPDSLIPFFAYYGTLLEGYLDHSSLSQMKGHKEVTKTVKIKIFLTIFA